MTARSPAPTPPSSRPAQPREVVQRWRLVVARAAGGADQAQRSQLAAWEAALEGCGLPIAGLDGSPSRPRFAPAAPLAAAIAGEAELLDIWLVERLPHWRVREALERRMPPGHRLVDTFDVWLGEAALPGQVVASVYRAEIGTATVDRGALRAACGAMLIASTLPRSRQKGEATVSYDLRSFVDDVTIDDSDAPDRTVVRMVLRHDTEKGIGRPAELLAELGDRLGAPLAVHSLVRERLILASERAVGARRGQAEPPVGGGGQRDRG